MIDCVWYGRSVDVSESSELTITSPNYPFDYGNDMDCEWEVHAPPVHTGSYVVKVTFNDFDLQADNPASQTRCPYDSLTFTDGYAPGVLGRYCDTVHPEVLYSNVPHLTIEFRSDSRGTFKGFNITVTAVKSGIQNYILEENYNL